MNFDGIVSLATSGVQGLKAYEAGKPIEELQREYGVTDVVKLASNENPLGFSPKAKEAMEHAINSINLYPDGNAFELKQALSEYLGIAQNQITIGNGSNDLLEIIARSFADHSSDIIYSQHAFAVYYIVTQALGAKHVMTPAKEWGHDLTAMADAITDKTKIIFIANPNNPTGTYLPENEIKAFLDTVPENIIVVLDEAYHEYIDKSDYDSALQWVNEYSNLIVTRTFSKAYGLAGLRIGYSVSHPAVSDVLNRIRQPFNANSLALAAAQASLNDEQFIKDTVALNNLGMKQMTDAFKRLGLSYIPSVGNFVAVDVKSNGSEVYEALLHDGVIVRPVGPYQMPHHLRVSIGTEAQNQKFIQALEKVLTAKGVL